MTRWVRVAVVCIVDDCSIDELVDWLAFVAIDTMGQCGSCCRSTVYDVRSCGSFEWLIVVCNVWHEVTR